MTKTLNASLEKSFKEFADWWESAGLPFPPEARKAALAKYVQTYKYTMGLIDV